jgi:hypothetical protein
MFAQDVQKLSSQVRPQPMGLSIDFKLYIRRNIVGRRHFRARRGAGRALRRWIPALCAVSD